MQHLLPDVDPAALPWVVQAVSFFIGMLVLAGIAIDLVLLILLRIKPVTRPELRARMAGRPWNGRDVIFMVLVLVMTFLAFQVALQVLLALELNRAANLLMPLQTLVFQLVAFLAVRDLLRRRGLSWRRAFGLADGRAVMRLAQGVVLYLAALPVVAFYALMSVLVLRWLGIPPAPQLVIEILSDPGQPLALQLYLVALAVAGAPVVEELLFRGVALPALARRFNLTAAMALTSIVFGAIHVAPASILPLFAFAMALSLAYAYTGSLLVPIVMHACFNTASLAVLALMRIAGAT